MVLQNFSINTQHSPTQLNNKAGSTNARNSNQLPCVGFRELLNPQNWSKITGTNWKAFLQLQSSSILLLYEWPRSDSALKKTLIGHYLLNSGDLRKKKLNKEEQCVQQQRGLYNSITLTMKQPGQQTPTTTFPISICCHAIVLCKKTTDIISLKLFLFSLFQIIILLHFFQVSNNSRLQMFSNQKTISWIMRVLNFITAAAKLGTALWVLTHWL